VAHEGYGTFQTAVTARAGEELSVTGEPISLVKVIKVKETTPVYKRWWPWTTAALVVAGAVVTGAVLGTRSTSGPPELHLPPVKAP
jgi:hypothetical protein